MRQVIVAIFDVRVEAYGRPAFVRSIGEAMRSFQDEVNNKESVVCAHPEDYRLFHLGVYDDSVGRFENLEAPLLIADGANLKMFNGGNSS